MGDASSVVLFMVGSSWRSRVCTRASWAGAGCGGRDCGAEVALATVAREVVLDLGDSFASRSQEQGLGLKL
jgi:hypothetical protein